MSPRSARFISLTQPWWYLIRPVPWPTESMPPPRFQSHRGYHLGGPVENSLEAFRLAAERGAQACECDVQLSSDSVPIIYHDESLMRLHGEDRRIEDTSAKTLVERWGVPSLKDLLKDPRAPRFINIELKTRRVSGALPGSVARVVRACGAEKRVMFSSFNPFALRQMQSLIPGVPRALLVSGSRVADNAWYLRKMLFAPLLKIQMLNLGQELATPQMITYWNRRKMPLSVWTILKNEHALELLSLGVTGIIADFDPALFTS